MDDTEQPKDQSPKTENQSVAAILLAAGRSARMGAFKPLLPFGQTSVIEACIEYLKTGGVETIVLVLGHNAETIRQHINDPSVLFAVNSDPASEMSESIRCGVEKLPAFAAATLVALVDHPAVPPRVVETLIEEWKRGAELIIPTWQGRGGHPVLIDLRWRRELENLDGASGLKSLFQKEADRVTRVPVRSEYIARDMDTWDDYTRLYADVFGQAPPVGN
ncbi:MAG TPA: nucleotidyltransferase family protein [Pyrinomonadaceae bacterium]|nr:nucleotidyltransferase family protein [Pyrinomonadaceae bacterium]